MTWEPVLAREIQVLDVVKRDKNGKARLVTDVERITYGPRARPVPGVRVTFEDSGPPYWLESADTANWYRRRRTP